MAGQLSTADIKAIAEQLADVLDKRRAKPTREKRAPVEVVRRQAPQPPSQMRQSLAIGLSNVSPRNAKDCDMPAPMIGALLAIRARGGVTVGPKCGGAA